MERRDLLKLVLATTVASGATGVAIWRMLKALEEEPEAGQGEPPGRPPQLDQLVAQLRESLPGYNIASSEFEAFFHAQFANREILQRFGRSIDAPARFLLSSDFFANGADKTRPLKFVTFCHPYVVPCMNPLRLPAK